MAKKNSMTLAEVKEMVSNVSFINEVNKQLEKFDNEIYHIRNGKISYQPQLIENLLEVAHELGNIEFIAKLVDLRGVKYDVSVDLDVDRVGKVTTGYRCTLKSNLPDLSPLSREGLQITFENKYFLVEGHLLGSIVESTLIDSIQEDFKDKLDCVKVISLYNTKNSKKLFDVSKLSQSMNSKLNKLGIHVLNDVTKIEVTGCSSDIVLFSSTIIVQNEKNIKEYSNQFTFTNNNMERQLPPLKH